MKGHLGFFCRPCLLPGAPTSANGSVTQLYGGLWQQSFSWTAPTDTGGRSILGYRVFVFDGVASWVLVNPGELAQTNEMGVGTFLYPWCRQSDLFRVAAVNECGIGEMSDSAWGGYATPPTPEAYIYTSTGSAPLTCQFTGLTAFAIGKGGQYSTGGAGGGLVWKTWTYATRDAAAAYDTVGYSITSSETSVTFNGTTITAYAGSNTEAGGWSGGDGGASGNPPGQGSASFSSAGIPYSGAYYRGGSIGGSDPGGPGGTQIYPSPVSPCQRQPARDRNSLLSRVALAGGKSTEDCGVQAAFGSGGVRVPYSAYGASSQYFAPGYGGGGFDSTCPAGPGAVVLYFHNG